MTKRLKNILLTGGIGIGKSTAIGQVIEKLALPYQGLFTERVLANGQVVGYGLTDETHTRISVFAHKDFASQYKLGRFGYDPLIFEKEGIAICSALNPSTRLFVIDEIGLMEKDSPRYLKEILRLLNSPLPLLAVVQKRADYFWQLVKEREDVITFTVTEKNRKQIVAEILSHIRSIV